MSTEQKQQYEEIKSDYLFDALEHAQEYLRDHGWKEHGATGSWWHVQRPGVIRDIRRPNQGKFQLVELRPKA